MKERSSNITIGVLALQGDFEAHQRMLERLGIGTRPVRSADELEMLHGLILPGGESTTIGKLIARHGLEDPIRERAHAGLPMFGTCAGLILLANEIEGSDQLRLGLMDIRVSRNAFGRQVDSFEADIAAPEMGEQPVRGVFIRAPYVTRCGAGVEVLAEFEGKTVAVRQKHILGTAFHPELTEDTRVHAYFLKMIGESLNPNP